MKSRFRVGIHPMEINTSEANLCLTWCLTSVSLMLVILCITSILNFYKDQLESGACSGIIAIAFFMSL